MEAYAGGGATGEGTALMAGSDFSFMEICLRRSAVNPTEGERAGAWPVDSGEISELETGAWRMVCCGSWERKLASC